MINPAGHIFLRGNGEAAAPGWPTSPRSRSSRCLVQGGRPRSAEELAEQMQLRVFQDVPYIPLGQSFQPTAYQANLTGVLPGNPVFWNIQRS